MFVTTHPDFSSPRIAILGGGPGGYEAAMVAASLGAQVTIIERAGLGGSAVLTDVVPSKTLIATADLMTRVGEAATMAASYPPGPPPRIAIRGELKSGCVVTNTHSRLSARAPPITGAAPLLGSAPPAG